MKISVVKTFVERNAGTEKSEMARIKIKINDEIIAGFIIGRIIFLTTFVTVVIKKPASSKLADKFFKLLEIMIIEKGVNFKLSTKITPQGL